MTQKATDEFNVHYMLKCTLLLIMSPGTHNIIKPSNHLWWHKIISFTVTAMRMSQKLCSFPHAFTEFSQPSLNNCTSH